MYLYYLQKTHENSERARRKEEEHIPHSAPPPPPPLDVTRLGACHSRTHVTNKGYRGKLAKHSFTCRLRFHALNRTTRISFPSSGSNQQMWLSWSRICQKQLQLDPLHGFISKNTLPSPFFCSYFTFPSPSCLISHCI